MIRILKQHESSIIVLGPLLFLFDWMMKWFTGWGQPYQWSHELFFLEGSFSYMNNVFAIRHCLHGAMALLTGFYINRIYQGHNLLRRISNFPLLVYFALVMTIPVGWESVEIWFGVLPVVRSLELLLALIDHERPGTYVFDASILICLSSLIFKPMLIMLVVVYGACFYSNVLNWRTFLIPLSALALVAYFTWGLLYISGNRPNEVFSYLFNPAMEVVFGIDLWQKLAFGAISILSLLGLAGLGPMVARSTIKNRKKWYLLLLFGASVIIGFLVYPSVFWMSFLVASIVISLLVANLLVRLDKWKVEAYGILLVLVVVFSQISHF